MTPDRPRLDVERQAQAGAYARLQRRVGFAQTGLGLLYLMAWVVSGVAGRLTAVAGGSWAAELALVAVCLGLPWLLISLPIDYESGFRLPHRFGQSTQSLRDWLLDLVKGLILAACLGLPLLLGLYAVMRTWPQAWWGIATVGFLAFSVLLSMVAPILLMPIFNRFVPLSAEHADLADRLMRLSAAARRRVRGVYTFDLSRRTRAANAALVGWGRTRRIVLGDTLISEFTPDEIETVLAHELGHHVHHDIPVGVLAGAALMLAELWAANAVLGWAVNAGRL
ncbi:MAG TPA: M48 family metalloprotease, partial [Anaerolineales bacterium]|nr:M48 family metalloprotease [Anaerolineales bacterium]